MILLMIILSTYINHYVYGLPLLVEDDENEGCYTYHR